MEKAEKKVPYSPFMSMQRAWRGKSVESATGPPRLPYPTDRKEQKILTLLLSRVTTSCLPPKCNLLTLRSVVVKPGHELILISWMDCQWWKEPWSCWQVHKSQSLLQPNKKEFLSNWIRTEPIVWFFNPAPPPKKNLIFLLWDTKRRW